MRSCKRPRRSASPWIEATAQILCPVRSRANFSSAARPCIRRAPALIFLFGRPSGRQHLLDALGGGHVVDPLDCGVFARKPIEGGLVERPLAIGCLAPTRI